MQGSYFIPRVTIDQINGANQTLLAQTKAEHIFAMRQHGWHVFRPIGGWIALQIDKNAQATISPNIQRIELQVSLFNSEQGKVEAGITNMVFFNYPAKAKTS